MGQYIHFSDEQKHRAASVDLEDFLAHQGEVFVRSGPDKRLKSNHSLTIRGNEWYDFATCKGGGPISFVRTFYGLSYPEAVSWLLGGETGQAYQPAPPKKVEPPKLLEVPASYKDARQVFGYLVKRRHINFNIVADFVKSGLLFEDSMHHNAVFIGKDEHGVVRHVHKRSTNASGESFRMTVTGSDPHYSFHWTGTSKKLYVFEAPIDMLSYISLHPYNWQRHSYVACCGTSFIPVEWMLEQLPQVTKAFLCHDNDQAGWDAARRAAEQLNACGVEPVRDAPTRKDWNEDLTTIRQHQQKEASTLCQTFGS